MNSTNPLSMNKVATKLFSSFFFSSFLINFLFPLDVYYLFQIDGGINFFNQDKDKLISQYDLDNLKNTVAPVVNIRTGAIWDNHWITLVGYGFVLREEYNYRLNYFTLNQKAHEQRDIHNIHFQGGYFLFPYQSRFNISFETGLGWSLYRSILSTIDNYSASSESGLRERNQKLVFSLSQFYLSPTIKLYKNLRRGFGLGGNIYFGVQYTILFPSNVNFPQIILGFDASIDFSYKKDDEKKKTFLKQKTKEIESKTIKIQNQSDLKDKVDIPNPIPEENFKKSNSNSKNKEEN